MKTINARIGILLLLAGALFASLLPARAATSWVNATGDMLWTNANWFNGTTVISPAGNPWAVEVRFLGDASANVPGVVNCIVDTDVGVNNIRVLTSNMTDDMYYTVQLQPGVTVTITLDSTSIFSAYAGTIAADKQFSFAVQGQGSLIVGNTNTPITSSIQRIFATWPGEDGSFNSTVDLSGLDYFAESVGYIRLGANASSTLGEHGTFYLAKTNFLLLGKKLSDGDPKLSGLVVGANYATPNTGNSTRAALYLGEQNEIRTDVVIVGGPNADPGLLTFKPGWTNPTLKMRNINGVGAVGLVQVGDNVISTFDNTFGGTGIMDLSRGTVDIQATDIIVGRGINTDSANNGAMTGTLTYDSGTIAAQNAIIIGQCPGANTNVNNSGTGVVNVGTNATLTGQYILIGNTRAISTVGALGTGTLNINGGTVTLADTITETNSAGAVAGAFITTGDGTSTVNVTNGVLTATNGIDIDNLNLVGGVVNVVSANVALKMLQGTGTLNGGAVSVTNTLTVGNGGMGTLTNNGSLTLAGGCVSTLEVDLDDLSHDAVVGMSAMTNGGDLVVNNVGGTGAATNGATLQLLSAGTYAGAFSSASLPALPTGLYWKNNLSGDGTISITNVYVPTGPTNIESSLAGDQLTLSWSEDHTGWRLEVQTNSLNIGLSNNWSTMSGSTATNSVTVTVDPANGAVFYRLVYP